MHPIQWKVILAETQTRLGVTCFVYINVETNHCLAVYFERCLSHSACFGLFFLRRRACQVESFFGLFDDSFMWSDIDFKYSFPTNVINLLNAIKPARTASKQCPCYFTLRMLWMPLRSLSPNKSPLRPIDTSVVIDKSIINLLIGHSAFNCQPRDGDGMHIFFNKFRIISTRLSRRLLKGICYGCRLSGNSLEGSRVTKSSRGLIWMNS